MEPIAYEHTPSMLASQGYVSIPDLMKALNLSRAGLYRLIGEMDPPPKVQRVGMRAYYEVKVFVERVATGGAVRVRALKGKAGGTLAERGKAKASRKAKAPK